MSPSLQILVPYNPREAISLRQAAKIAGKSESTVRSWCSLYHVGRRVVGGPWQVSRVALAMLLDGDEAALNAYLAGDRRGPLVDMYFAALTDDADRRDCAREPLTAADRATAESV